MVWRPDQLQVDAPCCFSPHSLVSWLKFEPGCVQRGYIVRLRSGCSRGRHINSVGAGCPCYDQRRLLDAAVRLSRAGAGAMQPVVQLISDCADPAVPEYIATGRIPDPSLVTPMPDNGAAQGKRPVPVPHEESLRARPRLSEQSATQGAVPECVPIEEAVPVTRKDRTMSQSGHRGKLLVAVDGEGNPRYVPGGWAAPRYAAQARGSSSGVEGRARPPEHSKKGMS